MFFFFISSKIFLTAAAAYLITQASPWLVAVFAMFILIDLVDSKVMGPDYRPYDSFFDRAFAYICFFTFFVFSAPVYPAIIYIATFAFRDLFLAGTVQDTRNYLAKSNMLDRGTMLATAIFFSLQAGGIVPLSGAGIETLCFIFAVLVMYQGVDKSRRIKALATER